MTDVVLKGEMVEEYFRDARERHAVYLRRRAGMSKPWTNDPVMQNYRITNVFRELDKTTVHLRTHVRDPLRTHPLVLPAVALYRWFTLIRTGETLFLQPSFLDAAADATSAVAAAEGTGRGRYAADPAVPAGLAAAEPGKPATPWQRWLATEDVKELEWALRKQGAPGCTGAFMIRSPIGMDKLEGVLSSFRSFWEGRPHFRVSSSKTVPMNWMEVADYCLSQRRLGIGTEVSCAQVHEWLKNFYGLGDFLANEIVSDLRHTDLLDRAPDAGTFNSPGPGALRGAYLMIYGVKQGRKDRLEKASMKETLAVMDALREMSRDVRYWPQWNEEFERYDTDGSFYDTQLTDVFAAGFGNKEGAWPVWGGREPGMWLCEMTKLKRTRLGIGRPRGNYE